MNIFAKEEYMPVLDLTEEKKKVLNAYATLIHTLSLSEKMFLMQDIMSDIKKETQEKSNESKGLLSLMGAVKCDCDYSTLRDEYVEDKYHL